MTNSFITEFDALAHAAFADAGLADVALYTSAQSSAPSVQCRVLVDRSLQTLGFESAAVTRSTVIRAWLADIGCAPTSGAIFAIGNERFVVDRVDTIDEGIATCLATREVAP